MKNEIIEVLIPVVSGIASFIEARFDAKQTRKIEHLVSATTRFIIVSVGCIYLYNISLHALTLTIFSLTVYWAVFDVSYNYFRGVNLWYMGVTSNTDRYFRRIFKEGKSYLFAKVVFGFFTLMIHKALYNG